MSINYETIEIHYDKVSKEDFKKFQEGFNQLVEQTKGLKVFGAIKNLSNEAK